MKRLTVLCFAFLFPALLPAQSLRKAYKLYLRRDYPAAQAAFERHRRAPNTAAAARYFQTRIRLNDTRTLTGLLALDAELLASDSLYRRLPPRKARRQQRRYGLDTAAIADLRVQAQRWAVAGTRSRGTLPALDSLLLLLNPLAAVRPAVEEAHTDIVNAHLQTTDYDTMTAILRRHIAVVLPENYDQTRRMAESLWPAFLAKNPPCALDRFARDHPLTFAGRDCWRDTVRALLCQNDLPAMLDFHARNRWTALEVPLLNAIADRARDSLAVAALPEAGRRHVLDLQRRNALRGQLHSGSAARDTAAALAGALDYIRLYAPRFSAYRLLEESLQFFLEQRCYASAIALLQSAWPYFPDTLPARCSTNFDYQLRVRPWIDGKLPILQQATAPTVFRSLSALNTPEGDESNPVVSADGLELYFAASGRPGNRAGTDIFSARRSAPDQDWGAPALVAELSGPGQQIPLSLTRDGRSMLLFVQGRLHTSRRDAPGQPWSTPVPLPVSGIPVMGKGCWSADGNILILEGAYSAGTPTDAPDLDLFVSLRDPTTGAWSRPSALGADINTDGEEANPCLSPDGRTLWYTSTGYPGLGRGDVFVANRRATDWTHWSRPENLGKTINNTLPHPGLFADTMRPGHFWTCLKDENGRGDLWELSW